MPLLSRNVHPKYVQELVGHYSSISVTLDTYSPVIPGVEDALDHSAPSRVRYQTASRRDASLSGQIMRDAPRAIMRRVASGLVHKDRYRRRTPH